MVWYNPLSWYKKKDLQQSLDYKLVCDNPQCKKVINDSEVAYDEDRKEFYHSIRCPQMAVAHNAFRTSIPQFMQLNYLPLEEAIKLKKGLESKL